jgi:hypothetical protein
MLLARVQQLVAAPDAQSAHFRQNPLYYVFFWQLQVFSGVRVTRSLGLYVCFVDRCLFFCTFSFGH